MLAAVHALAQKMPAHRLVFGLDANTYAKHSEGKKQGVTEFARDFVSKGYSSCWGDAPDPTNHTTFNARTFLQAQLQKAARSSEKVGGASRTVGLSAHLLERTFSALPAHKPRAHLRGRREVFLARTPRPDSSPT